MISIFTVMIGNLEKNVQSETTFVNVIQGWSLISTKIITASLTVSFTLSNSPLTLLCHVILKLRVIAY